MSLSQGSDLFSSEHNLKFWEDNLSKELGKLIMLLLSQHGKHHLDAAGVHGAL